MNVYLGNVLRFYKMKCFVFCKRAINLHAQSFKAVAKAAVDFVIIIKVLVLMSYVQKVKLLETLKVFEAFFL